MQKALPTERKTDGDGYAKGGNSSVESLYRKRRTLQPGADGGDYNEKGYVPKERR